MLLNELLPGLVGHVIGVEPGALGPLELHSEGLVMVLSVPRPPHHVVQNQLSIGQITWITENTNKTIRFVLAKLLPFQVFPDTIVPVVHLSVEDGVHVLGRLDDEVQHLPLVVSEVLDVGGDRDGRVLRDLNAESL